MSKLDHGKRTCIHTLLCPFCCDDVSKIKTERDALRELLKEWMQAALITRWHPSLTKKTLKALGEENPNGE